MVVYGRMSCPKSREEELQVAALAQRIQGLEAELTEARAQLIGMHSKLMYARSSFYEDEQTQVSVLNSAAVSQGRESPKEEREAPIHIEPLPVHHPLRRKWALGRGVGSAHNGGTATRICFTGTHVPAGKMRILGLLTNGEVWEHYIPFTRLAKEGGVTIGRDADAVDLSLPENGVSRMHARIELGSTGLVITDLHSTNGLYINNEHINSYSPQKPLTDGAIIRMGDTALRIELIYGSQKPHSPSNIS